LKDNGYKIVKENYGTNNSFILVPFTMNSKDFKLTIKNNDLTNRIKNILAEIYSFLKI